MFGNTKGWVYAAIVAVAMSVGIYAIATPASPTPPTGSLKLGMQPAVLPTGPETVLPAPTKECDAAELYRKAIDEYTSHKHDYEKFSEKVTGAVAANPQAVQYLLQAADCGSMHLFDKKPDQVITYADRPELDAIDNVGTLCGQMARVYASEARHDVEHARQYATAEFNLGRHLYDERLVFSEWSDGISMMSDAASVLALVETDASKKEALTAFSDGADSFQKEKVIPFWQILSGIAEDYITRYAGDVQQMASKQNPERMWRIEALFKLGRYRYMSGTKGDQFYAKHETGEIAKTDSDPLVKLAADKAHNLSSDDYHLYIK